MSTRPPIAAVVAALGLCLILLVGAEDGSGRSYVAAVYEHFVYLNPKPHVPLSRAAALEHMKKNLDVYEAQAALAAGKVDYICRNKTNNSSCRRSYNLVLVTSLRVLRL